MRQGRTAARKGAAVAHAVAGTHKAGLAPGDVVARRQLARPLRAQKLQALDRRIPIVQAPVEQRAVYSRGVDVHGPHEAWRRQVVRSNDGGADVEDAARVVDVAVRRPLEIDLLWLWQDAAWLQEATAARQVGVGLCAPHLSKPIACCPGE